MRELNTERKQYKEITAAAAGLTPTAGYGPGAVRVFIPQGMDPAQVQEFLSGPVDKTHYRPLQPDPPEDPALRYWIPDLDLDGPTDLHPPQPGP